MNVEQRDGVILVTLSARNLRQLSRAVELGKRASLARRTGEGAALVVTVEDDAVHYADRMPGPGNWL